MREALQTQSFSLEQVVILASIVEREAMHAEEYPLITSIFLNRLDIGMKLESDPTAQYALGKGTSWEGWWKNPMEARDLSVSSPYNTYQINGLPPTAICQPSIGAIRAVLEPQTSPYYFFRAACDGSGWHNFSITYEEHLSYGCP
jgi:UPF0755 protein